jgi:hypothetical protein
MQQDIFRPKRRNLARSQAERDADRLPTAPKRLLYNAPHGQ